jgi:hydrogenase nickel incorporation protein HypB
VRVVSRVSSPGAGKTALLERLLALAGRTHRVAALTGYLATENDAARLARSGAPVRQIVTGTVCHLEAQMVDDALGDGQAGISLHRERGQPGLPGSYDLGESLRLVLPSVTEGEDKPLKYPTIFHTADAAVLTKMDLAAEFDLAGVLRNINSVRPGMPVLPVSAKTSKGRRGPARLTSRTRIGWRRARLEEWTYRRFCAI